MSNDQMQWQTLSPFALVYFIVHFFFRFIKDGILNVLPPFTVLLLQVENKLLWFSIGAAALIVGVIIYAVAFFLCFKYKLSKDDIQLQQGVLKKQQLTLNFAKIQNVNISSPFYFRPFNLVNAQLDAAGSKGQEVVLAGIVREKAEEIREQVFNYNQTHAPVQELEPTAEQTLPKLSLKNAEVAKFGLFSSTIFLLLASLVTFQKHIEPILTNQLLTPLSTHYLSVTEHQDTATTLAFITIALGLLLAMLVFSVAMALLRFYNFELTFADEKLKRTCGLLERAQFSLQKSKIQSIEVKQNAIALLLKRFTLNCKQINNSTTNKAKKQQAFVVPVLNQQQTEQVLDLCWDKSINLHQVQFTPIAIDFFYRTFLLFALLPVLLACAVKFTVIDMAFIGWALGYFVLASSFSYLRYKRYGYAFYQDFAIVRKGIIGVSYKVFETYKIQQVSQIQTQMMARKGLASLRFTLASGNITVPYLPVSQVEQQIDHSLHLAQSSNRSWM